MRFPWGRMESCAAIGNRRACRLPTGTQLAKLPHKRTVFRGQGTSGFSLAHYLSGAAWWITEPSSGRIHGREERALRGTAASHSWHPPQFGRPTLRHRTARTNRESPSAHPSPGSLLVPLCAPLGSFQAPLPDYTGTTVPAAPPPSHHRSARRG